MLGPVEVRRDGEPVAIPGGKTAELLVRLALEAGTPVRADRLLDDLWARRRRPTATRCSQKVARLRRSLGDPSLIAGGDDGYRLAVEPAAVDALAVLRDVDAATALLDAGDARGAARAERGGAWRCSAATCCLRPATGPRRTGPGSRRRGCSSSRPASRRGCGSATRRDRRAGSRRRGRTRTRRACGSC